MSVKEGREATAIGISVQYHHHKTTNIILSKARILLLVIVARYEDHQRVQVGSILNPSPESQLDNHDYAMDSKPRALHS